MIDRGRVIREESDQLGAALAGCDPTTQVPTCPAWTAADLLGHVVKVQQFWSVVIGDRLNASGVADYERDRSPLPTDMATLLALRPRITDDLLAALHDRQPSEPAWSWFPADQTVGFSWRMQTHEVLMHRVDAELAAGQPIGPISTEVAGDGVDHAVDVMWAWAPAGAERRRTGTVELLATDSGHRWLLGTFRWSGTAWGQDFVDQVGCERVDTGVPDATLSGTAADLDLLVWGRGGQQVSRTGRSDALEDFQTMVDEGMQ